MTSNKPAGFFEAIAPTKLRTVDILTDSQPTIPITAIIPAHNVETYIESCLSSVLSQRPRFEKIIIVDDGSTDHTVAKIQNFADPRIHIVRQENGGPGAARNTGLAHATTLFVSFVDGDDQLADGMLNEFNLALSETPGLDCFAYAATDFSDSQKLANRYKGYYQRLSAGLFASGTRFLMQSLTAGDYLPSPCLFVIRRKILTNKPKLQFNFNKHEDEVFTPQMLLRCGQILVTDIPFYQRRVRAGSIMTSNPTISSVAGYFEAAHWWYQAAANYQNATRSLFIRRACSLYSLGLSEAKPAGLSLTETKDLCREVLPEMSKFSRWDASMARAGRRLALAGIVIRELARQRF